MEAFQRGCAASDSVALVLEGKTDIAVGNVVGSNIFNILGCMEASSLMMVFPVPLTLIAVLVFLLRRRTEVEITPTVCRFIALKPTRLLLCLVRLGDNLRHVAPCAHFVSNDS